MQRKPTNRMGPAVVERSAGPRFVGIFFRPVMAEAV